MTHSNLPCAMYVESCGFGLTQKQTKIVMELPVACHWEKTSVPFPAWRQCRNHLWIQAPPSPWLTFKEQKPRTTQIAAPFSMSEKKSHCITFFYTLMQAEKVPKMLLISVVKGLLASCQWLCNAGTHRFPSSLQEVAASVLLFPANCCAR